MLSRIPTRHTQFVPSWHCSDCSDDEDAVLCVEGDYGAVLESDSLPFAVSSLTEVSAISIDCDAARNISLASMSGIKRAQIGRMKRSGQCYSLPPLPSCLKELCVINVNEKHILTAVERQKELRSLTIRKPILDKCTALTLESLPPEKWSKLENLEKLTMTSSSLKKFLKSIAKITALNKLDLSDNSEIKRLPEDIGSKLKNLEELYMSCCDLQKLPISLGYLTALKKLHLRGNSKLKSLPKDIWSKLEHLEELDLRCCGLQQLPISLGNLTALKKLDLCGNSKLKSLPEDIWSKLQNMEELDLRWCNLKQLPSSLSSLTVLTKIALSGNRELKSLPGDIGTKLQNLEELHLRWCKLQQLPSSLSNLTVLKKLDVSGNSELKSLPGDIGTKLQNLEELELRWCDLHQLPSSLSNITALKKLDLSGNRELKSLPGDIGTKLKNLEKLDLRRCGLQQLPSSLSNLTALKRLNLSGNSELKSLPEDIGSKLQNLKKLILKGCGLQQLPSSLSNLTALKKLDLSVNRELKSLPEDIGTKLQNLEELYLRMCGLQQFPIGLSSLTALKKLDMRENSELKSLPEDIGTKLQNLEELDLWGCRLEQLPSSLSNLTALKKLDLSGNSELKSLPEDIVGTKLQNLEELNLKGCGLQQLPSSFSSLTSLKKIDLSVNSELKSLPEGIGTKLQNLEEFSLWGCGLQQLPISLSSLTALKTLYLRENIELKSLPEDMFQKLEHLKELDMHYCGLEELPLKLGFLEQLNVANCRLTRLPSSIGQLQDLNCFGNPITFPPIGVWQQGLASIRAYFSSEILTSSRRVKIVVLGESCSGKTSLFQTMLRNASFCTCLEDRTIGVEEYELSLAKKRAKIIDCGGQRCYILTNQLFVSENGLVVIVVDVQRYELTDESFYEHIGKYLQVVYERNENCYVVCVFTKVDLLPKAWNPKPYQEEFTRQMKNFREHRKAIIKENHMWDEEKAAFIKRQNVRVENRLVFTSAKDVETTAKFTDFIDKLTDNEKLFPSAGDIVPETWYNFEERVERGCRLSQNNLSALKVDFLNKLGHQFSLSNDEVLIVLRYYHQVGTVLYFDQSRLADIVFGSSKKIVDALKQIFRHDYDVLVYESGTTEISLERFVKDKNELSTNATLSIPLLKALLRGQELDAESISIFVKMLLSFDFAYVKGEQGLPKEHSDHESYDIVDHLGRTDVCLLVPWLLSQDCPSDAMESFPADCPTNCIEVQLSYSFAFALPLGIFQQFSARCHQISPIIRHWNNGFTLSYGPVKAKFTCKELATNASILLQRPHAKITQCIRSTVSRVLEMHCSAANAIENISWEFI